MTGPVITDLNTLDAANNGLMDSERDVMGRIDEGLHSSLRALEGKENIGQKLTNESIRYRAKEQPLFSMPGSIQIFGDILITGYIHDLYDFDSSALTRAPREIYGFIHR